MTFLYFGAGLSAGLIVSWTLYRIPVSDGYDLLALLAVSCAAFDLGRRIGTHALRRSLGIGLVFILVFICVYLCFALSPYLLGAAFLIHAAGSVSGWLRQRPISGRAYIQATFSGSSLVLSIFVLIFYV